MFKRGVFSMLDIEMEMKNNKAHVSVLPLFERPWATWQCLILSRLKNGEYERIGYARLLLASNWSLDIALQTITIV